MAKKIDLASKMAGLQKTEPTPKRKSTTASNAVSKIHRGKTQKSTIEFESDLYRKLKMKAFEKDLSLRALIMEYLTQGLDSEE
jgi:hypothetical protein